jgi:HSP20 family molecular chaperone IbpA
MRGTLRRRTIATQGCSHGKEVVMQPTRWSSFPELEAMERRMRRFFDEIGPAPARLPAADVFETEGDYVFEFEVPGFEEKQLAIQVSDHTLAIKGERDESTEEKGKTFHLRERLATQFERRFELPPDVIGDKVFAEFDAGVLTVHAPKEKATEPRNVTIGAK